LSDSGDFEYKIGLKAALQNNLFFDALALDSGNQ
jgi:hypothetical protein